MAANSMGTWKVVSLESIPQSPIEEHTMSLLPWQRSKISHYFSLRFSIREIARRLGISKNTVTKYRKELPTEPLCKCGRNGSHKGICSARRLRKHKTRTAKPVSAIPIPTPAPVSESDLIAIFIATRGVQKLPTTGSPEISNLPPLSYNPRTRKLERKHK